MKLKSVRIENFRSFKDETIAFNDYTCLVGPNGGGKSTVFTALNIFFGETSNATTDLVNLDEEDFHHKQTDRPIVITVTFEDLSPEAQVEFKDYFRQDQLVITAKANWDPDTNSATVKQFGQRMGMGEFKVYFEADKEGLSASELKEIYKNLKNKYTELPVAGSKTVNTESLQQYEATHPELCELIPSEDQFYGVSKGKNRLEKYVQWVFVPAIKDASTEQVESKKTALGQLIERAIKSKKTLDEPLEKLKKQAKIQYSEMLKTQQATLDALSASLNSRLQTWSHPNASLKLKWPDDVTKLVDISSPLAEILAGEGDFKGKIMRFGHGLQRSYIFALLQELSDNGNDSGPKLILACEEPELYQHPPQARYLATVFQKLSNQNAQITVCTHSPFFVSGKGFEDVRLIRKKLTADETCVQFLKFSDLSAKISRITGEAPITYSSMVVKIEQALSPAINEIFFADTLILVEGLEDVAYIQAYLTLMDKAEEFRQLGCHIVPCNNKSQIIQPLAIATSLNIPTFVLFDSDGNKPDKNGSRTKHEKDNKTIQALAGIKTIDPFPTKILWENNLVAWDSEIGEVVKNDFGDSEWTKLADSVRVKYDINADYLNKNAMFIGYILAEAWDQRKKSDNLVKLIETILDFSKTKKSKKTAIVSPSPIVSNTFEPEKVATTQPEPQKTTDIGSSLF